MHVHSSRVLNYEVHITNIVCATITYFLHQIREKKPVQINVIQVINTLNQRVMNI